MPYLVRTRFGEKVKTTVSILRQNYERLRGLADLRFGGNLSLALDYVLDWFFRVMGTCPDLFSNNTQIVIMSGESKHSVTSVSKSEKSDSRDARSLKQSEDILDEELNYVEVETALNHYISLLEGFKQRLGTYLKFAKRGIRVDPPQFIEIKRQLDKISKELTNFVKKRRIPTSLTDLFEKCQSLLKEVKLMLIEAERL